MKQSAYIPCRCNQRVNETISIYTMQHRGRDRQVYNQRVSERIDIYTMLHYQGETGIYAFVHTAMSILNNCMDMEGQGTLHEFAKNQFTGSQKTRFMEETFEKTKMFSSFHPYNMFQFFCSHKKIMTVYICDLLHSCCLLSRNSHCCLCVFFIETQTVAFVSSL